MPSHKQREMIQYARRFPKRGVQDFRERLSKAAPVSKKLDAVLVVFDRDTYDSLRRYAKRNGSTIPETIIAATKSRITGVYPK